MKTNTQVVHVRHVQDEADPATVGNDLQKVIDFHNRTGRVLTQTATVGRFLFCFFEPVLYDSAENDR